MSNIDDVRNKIDFKTPLVPKDFKLPSVASMVNTGLLESVAQETLKMKNDYEQAVLQTLQNIESNTADIGNLISVVQKNKENQEEVLEVLKSIMEITSVRTEEEADIKYREVMDKANKLNSDIQTIDSLITYGKTMWIGIKNYYGFGE
ncbi:hypothetical protein [Sediminibacillus terrae]|uniref:hypothetical protein n=1 Tax=Sediminibacillus terrae TaxID=1562106 RepID=UPI001297FDB9|nr:hypothetical protein [Sediminibacillus terrae]